MALVVALGLGSAITIGAAFGDTGYTFVAEFDNADVLVPGENVKVGGATVGEVVDTELSSDRRHAIVKMRINEPGLSPFKTDADCSIRPQSLIGEKYVDCTPGTPSGDPLPPDENGVPRMALADTHGTVDPDLVLNTLRMPYRQRLRIVLNEFGTALAGNGGDLNEAIRRAAPALQETDKVLRILGDQSRNLKELISGSESVVSRLAENRKAVAEAIVETDKVMGAVANQRGNLEAAIAGMPALLRQLDPTLVRLGALSDALEPVLADLRRVAPDLNDLLTDAGPFAREAEPALTTLGAAASSGISALDAFAPVAEDVQGVAERSVPVARSLSELLTSLEKEKAGIKGAERTGYDALLQSIYKIALSFNSFDAFGHQTRNHVIGNACIGYVDDEYTSSQNLGSCTQKLGNKPGGAESSMADVPLGGAPVSGSGSPSATTSAAAGASPKAGRKGPRGSGPGLTARDRQLLDYLLKR